MEDFKKSGGSIFLTTNVITEVDSHLDHIFILKKGELIFNGKKEDINNFQCPLINHPLNLEDFFSRLHHPHKEDTNDDQAA